MTVNEKVEKLRNLLNKNGLSAWIINGTDPHESEYVCERWQSRKWISGFTGSAGTVIITEEKALIWVDSRYFVQCAQQIKGTCFEMRKLDGPEASSPVDFLHDEFANGEKVGISAETLMVSAQRRYQEKHINIVACDDLLNQIWENRPQMPHSPIFKLSSKITGETATQKIERIREAAAKDGAQTCIISSLDDIAWILNLRGNEIQNTPVFLAHLIIGPDYVKLFTPKERFNNANKSDAFEVLPYEAVAKEISKIKGTVVLNPMKINMMLYKAINKKVEIIEHEEYSTLFKACKNPTEMEGMRIAHLLDGVALVNFLSKVYSGKNSYSEVSIAQELLNEKQKEESFIETSFDTIAGFAENGAIVHYSATPETDKKIESDGLLVLDCGSHYSCGTTDITRTLVFGNPTEEQMQDYTLVLKGHLALAGQVFPKGTSGHQLDILAHQFLWNNGMTYFHGTGHGVGHVLSVHEGPHRISPHPNSIALEPGMVVSDEPGVYKEGKHGIRIENLIAVTEAFENEFGKFYGFEVLTCCPYERRLIKKDMLTREEIKSINDYHKWVYKMLKDMVEPSALPYLKQATKAL